MRPKSVWACGSCPEVLPTEASLRLHMNLQHAALCRLRIERDRVAGTTLECRAYGRSWSALTHRSIINAEHLALHQSMGPKTPAPRPTRPQAAPPPPSHEEYTLYTQTGAYTPMNHEASIIVEGLKRQVPGGGDVRTFIRGDEQRRIIAVTEHVCRWCEAGRLVVQAPGSETAAWLRCLYCGDYRYFVGAITCGGYYASGLHSDEVLDAYRATLEKYATSILTPTAQASAKAILTGGPMGLVEAALAGKPAAWATHSAPEWRDEPCTCKSSPPGFVSSVKRTHCGYCGGRLPHAKGATP